MNGCKVKKDIQKIGDCVSVFKYEREKRYCKGRLCIIAMKKDV